MQPNKTFDQKPLVSLILIAYNQEQFVEDAVNSLFDQTYSPLEIVLSDDCSSDNTFGIISKLAENYDGPHQLVLNRNKNNLGIGSHVNKVVGIAGGELIVVAAGDDVSRPERVQVLADIWSKEKPSALSSGYILIDKESQKIGNKATWVVELTSDVVGDNRISLELFVTAKKFALTGCTQAWDRRLFELFGPLVPELVYEDHAMTFRAWLLDGIRFLEQNLVYYRQHAKSVQVPIIDFDRSVDNFRLFETKCMQQSHRMLALLDNYQKDISTAYSLELIDQDFFDWLKSEICRQQSIHLHLSRWWSVSTFQRIKWYQSQLLKHGKGKYAKWGLIRLMPFELFLRIRICTFRFRDWMF